MNSRLLLILVFVLAGVVFWFIHIQPKERMVSAGDSAKLKQFITKTNIVVSDVVVRVTKDSFEPSEINIKSGTRVVFINETGGYSWPASDQHPSHTDYPEFDAKVPMKDGEVWPFVFKRVGKWSFHDHLGPAKKGVIKVFE